MYPGASPERVETEVSDVLQNALTVRGVSKITATSAENYSLLLMQLSLIHIEGAFHSGYHR